PVFAALGSVALLAAVALSRERIAIARPRAVGVGARHGGRMASALALAGTGSLAALAEINSGLLGVDALAGAGPAAQVVLLAGGIALLTIGLGGVERPRTVSRALGVELAL